MNELDITLEMPAEAARICCESVGIEAKSEALARSKVELWHEAGSLRLTISAQDLGALRAALNTYLRWIIMCDEITEKERK